MPLTDKECKNSRPSERPVRLFDGGGLYLEIAPTGSKYWRLKYRFLGKEKKLSIGVYPEVTLSKARDARASAKKLLADNQDPSFKKQAARVQAKLQAANTFEQVAREWHSHKMSGWSETHGKTVLRRLEIDLFPVMGKFPIKDISSPELLHTLRRIEARAPEMARRCLQYTNDIYGYAIATGRAETSPGYKISKQLKPVLKGHYASIETREIPEFLSRLREHEDHITRSTCLAMRLMMLLFVRTNELVQMRWEEIDWERKTWFVSRTRMKNRKVHMVPLYEKS